MGTKCKNRFSYFGREGKMAIDKPLMSVCRNRSQTFLLSIMRYDNVDITFKWILALMTFSKSILGLELKIFCNSMELFSIEKSSTAKIKHDLAFYLSSAFDCGQRSHFIWICFCFHCMVRPYNLPL